MILQTKDTLNDLNSIYSIEKGFFTNQTAVNTLFNYKKIFENNKIEKIISNDSLNYYLKLIDKKEISMSKVARMMNCSRQWVSTLYQRYKKGVKLQLKKGHRKQVLTKEMKKKIAEIYLDLFYEYEHIKHVPSMKILKKVASEKIENFPEVHIETIRKTLKEQNVYVDKSGIKKYRKKFYTGSVGELINGGVYKHKWISNNNNQQYLIIFSDEKSKYILYAKIVEENNLENHYSALKDIVLTFGIPASLYYKNKLDDTDFNIDDKYSLISNTLSKLNVNIISSKLYQLQYKYNPINNFDIFRKHLSKHFKTLKPKSFYLANRYLLDFVEKFNSNYSILINDKPEAVFKDNIDVFKDITCNDLDYIENIFTKLTSVFVNNSSKIMYKKNEYFVPSYHNSSLISQNIEVKESPDKWIKLYYKNTFLVKYDLLYNFKN